MKVVNGLVEGPFQDEAAFKAAVLKEWGCRSRWHTHFQIENEEKEPGMPDTLSVAVAHPAFFTEFKYADRSGHIEFTKAQPLFYKQHSDLNIIILVWDNLRVVQIDPREVVTRKLKIPNFVETVCDVNKYSFFEMALILIDGKCLSGREGGDEAGAVCRGTTGGV